MNTYLDGKKLIGDDLDFNAIEKWYTEEKEYAEMYKHEGIETKYPYHELNIQNGYNYLPNVIFNKLLSIGGGYCDELIPIVDRLRDITVLEQSEILTKREVGNIPIKHETPNSSGKMVFEDNSFDIVTCFGVLHHIPNVSFVLSEIFRVLKPNGYLLLREPVVSMGDWQKERAGLTKNERGIPKSIFDKMILDLDFKIVKSSWCFTKPFDIFWGKYIGEYAYNSKKYVQIDRFLGNLLKFNYRYHATSKLEKIRPSCVFYVLQKK